MNLEVLIPLRNPTEVLAKTVDSLASQSEKGFSVLVSDNFSTTGHEHVESALKTLEGAGLKFRRLRPVQELGRVEHWNWIHAQSSAEWVKPLFTGDWLEPDYMASVRAASASDSRCAYIYSGFRLHTSEGIQVVRSNWRGRYFTPEELQDVVMRRGLQFGPPSAACYKLGEFMKCGGYEPSLPICADGLLFCKLAARFGGYGLEQPCANFNIHGARFSHKLREQERALFRESLTYYATLGILAWHERWRFPKIGYLRLFAREIRRHLKAK